MLKKKSNLRLKPGMSEVESDSEDESFMKAVQERTLLRKQTKKSVKKKILQSVDFNKLEEISKPSRNVPKLKKEASHDASDVENKLRAKLGENLNPNEDGEEEVISKFRLRTNPLRNETAEFQQDAFFDYIEVLLGDAQLIEEYLSCRLDDLKEFIDAVAWLNRQYVVSTFLDQTLIFHQDFQQLYEAAKKRDKVKFNTMKRMNSMRAANMASKGTLKRWENSGLKTLRNKSRQMIEVEAEVLKLIAHLMKMNSFYKEIENFDVCKKILWEIDCLHIHLFQRRKPQYAQNFYEMAIVHILAGQIDQAEFAFKKAMVEAERILGSKNKAVGTWCSNIGHLFKEKENYARAKEYFLLALEIDKNSGSHEDNEEVALDYENLAFIHSDSKEYKEAIKSIKEALRINKLCHGDLHKDVARNLATLSHLLMKTNDLKEAEKYLRIAVEINEKTFGNGSSELAHALYDLGLVLKISGSFKDSVQYMEQCVLVFRSSLKAKDECIFAKALINLASLLRSETGDLNRALIMLQEALKIKNGSKVEVDMVSIATIYFHLGEVLRDLGHRNEALLNLSKALEMRQQIVSTKNRVLPYTMNIVGNLMADMGKLNEGLALHRSALDLDRKILGEIHEEVAVDLTNVATLLADMRSYDEALKHMNESLEIRKKLYGTEDHKFASALNNKACIIRGQGDYEVAEDLFREAIKIGLKTLGAEHPDVALRKNNLAELLQKVGYIEESEKLYKEAYNSWGKSLGNDHPRVGLVVSSLALLLTDQGKYFEALPFQFQALDINKKAYGERDLTVARDLNNIGKLLRALGQLKEAEPCILQALSIRREKLGDKHAHLALSIENLALLRRAQKMQKEADQMGKDAYYMFVDTLGENHQWTIYSKNLWFKKSKEDKVVLHGRDYSAKDGLETERHESNFDFDDFTTLASTRHDSTPIF